MFSAIRRMAMAGLASAILVQPGHALCPAEFVKQVSVEEQSAGGIFYEQAVPGNFKWTRLVEAGFLVSGDLNLVFVPPADACASPDDPAVSRVDCGPDGFLLAKIHRVVADQATTQTVRLEHGDGFARSTGFAGASLENALYQNFHTSQRSANNRSLQNWHRDIPGRDEDHDSTFEPDQKKLQFAFDETELTSGTRTVRLFRFDNPIPQSGVPVCLDFTIGMPRETTMRLEIMMIEPVFNDDYLPTLFELVKN